MGCVVVRKKTNQPYTTTGCENLLIVFFLFFFFISLANSNMSITDRTNKQANKQNKNMKIDFFVPSFTILSRCQDVTLSVSIKVSLTYLLKFVFLLYRKSLCFMPVLSLIEL